MFGAIVDHDCPEPVRADAREYWSRKVARLERLLRGVPSAERRLRLVLRRPRERYEARAVLEVQGATLVARAESPYLLEALDVVADTLAREVRRHHDASRRRLRVRVAL